MATMALGDTLTLREVEILRLLARGLADKQIADELGIARETVSHHLQHIRDKLGVADRTSAVIWAFRSGLVA